MIDCINKLKKDYDIQIRNSEVPLRGENTFSLHEDGTVKSLFLDEVKLKNLDALLPLADTIVELTVKDCSINNIDRLKDFSKLKKLSLSMNPLPSKALDNLGYLQNLIELDLSVTNLKDTCPIGNLKHLKKLEVGGNDELYEIRGLEQLSYLSHFEMSYNLITSIQKVSLHENIQSINLKSGEIEEIEGLEKYPYLLELNLSGNKIAKIQGLDHLKQLKRLVLSSAWIEKIEGLENLTSLEILDLSDNQLVKIENLDQLRNLKKLNLSMNEIVKVENLDSLVNLDYLLLECNDINEFDSNFLHTLRSDCFISLVNNPLKELNVNVPVNIDLLFTEQYWMPKRL